MVLKFKWRKLMHDFPWNPGTFDNATSGGRITQSGYVWRDLGLHLESVIPPSPKGRRKKKQSWALTHLNSGHRICGLIGEVKDIFPLASEIAELTDWSFTGLYGWKKIDPELGDKFYSLIKKNEAKIKREGGSSDKKLAREIAVSRM